MGSFCCLSPETLADTWLFFFLTNSNLSFRALTGIGSLLIAPGSNQLIEHEAITGINTAITM